MDCEQESRVGWVNRRLEYLADKQDRNELSDGEIFEQQQLADEYERLVNRPAAVEVLA